MKQDLCEDRVETDHANGDCDVGDGDDGDRDHGDGDDCDRDVGDGDDGDGHNGYNGQ